MGLMCDICGAVARGVVGADERSRDLGKECWQYTTEACLAWANCPRSRGVRHDALAALRRLLCSEPPPALLVTAHDWRVVVQAKVFL